MDTHATARRPWQALDAARRLPRPYFLVVLLALMHTDLAHAFSLPFSLGASRFLARGVASNGGLLADAFGGRARPATLSQLSMSGGRGGGRGGRGGSRGRGGGGSTTSTGRFPVPTAPKAQDRAGMSRKDWDLASTIGGPKKSAQQLAQLLGLAKVGKLAELEESWEREGASKNEVKRRIKVISKWKADSEVASTPAALAADSQLRCVHFGVCSGCSAETDLKNTPMHQKARAMFSKLLPREAAPFEIHMGEVHKWRTQAKLAVAVPPGKAVTGIDIGLYKANSHEVLAIPKCRVHHPSINRAAELVRKCAKDLSVRPFDENSGRGQLRYIQMSVERYSGKVQLTLVWNADDYKDAGSAPPRLAKQLNAEGEGLFHSIWVNLRTGGGNAILERDPLKWSCISGPEYLNERLFPSLSTEDVSIDAATLNAGAPQNPPAGQKREMGISGEGVTKKGEPLTFPMSPTMFRQGNLDQFASIIKAIRPFIPPGSRVTALYGGAGLIGLSAFVTELYGGAGLIGLSAALPQCEWLRCSDENPNNLAAFLKVKRQLLPRVREKVSYESFTAEDAISGGLAEGAEVLIVDPPRKGLQLVARWIASEAPASLRRVIYVSCGFQALEDDLALILAPSSSSSGSACSVGTAVSEA
ncbi:hypothetical protein T484DRAFT_1882602 [Baffinella frigidus]|nr:hypothetical protein T484DRAFT_1882602 [Cryptophyta sp. CCMP2293]